MESENSESDSPVPFLRWAGGKRRLADLIANSIPSIFDGQANNFFEPFVGGGAVSFHLGNQDLTNFVPGENLYINDSNPDLIATYLSIRDEPDALLSLLKNLALKKDQSEFEKIKAWRPNAVLEQAARFIYLNKTCFNGLWRVNSRGEFNVPWGKLKNPQIANEENILKCSARLKKATITNLNYSNSLEKAKSGDVVYMDPPYLPLSSSSNFSKYAKNDFGVLDHYALAGVIQGLTDRGVHVILSNSDTPLTREIFGHRMTLRQISVQRSISANAGSRIAVNELIGVNFKIINKSNFGMLKVVS
jgi:DNA adenine methylase